MIETIAGQHSHRQGTLNSYRCKTHSETATSNGFVFLHFAPRLSDVCDLDSPASLLHITLPKMVCTCTLDGKAQPGAQNKATGESIKLTLQA